MIDQSLVQSGYDIEVLLGAGYLRNLLLLGTDIGVIPLEHVTDGEHPVHMRLMAPPVVDRTYDVDSAAPQLEWGGRDDSFSSEVLLGHPSGADLRVTARLFLSQPSKGLEISNVDLSLFVKLALDKAADGDGGLASASLGIELVDIDGGLLGYAAAADPPMSKDDLFAQLKPFVDRSLDLGGLGSSGRVGDLALRKHAATPEHPGALGLYLNLRLLSDAAPGHYVPARGDVSAAQNFLADGADVAMATRADLYGYLGPDAKYRRAEPDGDGYRYPIRRHPSDPTSEEIASLVEVTVAPTDASEPNKLRMDIHGEYHLLDGWLEPDFDLLVDIYTGVDDDGIMTWNSSSDLQAGLFVDVVLGILAAAFIPLLGGWSLAVFTGLEIGKTVALEAISEAVIDDKVEAKVDATLLDIAPNRLTITRIRWDPFYLTHHQIGLRPGGVLINEHGLAMWGTAALTRTTEAVRGVVIRDTVRTEEGEPTDLIYRVEDVDPVRADLALLAPGADRRPFSQPDAVNEPYLFDVGTHEAIQRIFVDRMESKIAYIVKRVEMSGGTVGGLLVISERENDEQRGALIDAHVNAARDTITAEQADEIRVQVIADFEAARIIATQQEIDDAVAARIEALVAADEKTYEDGQLAADLDAALEPLLRFALAPQYFGSLQDDEVLELKNYDLIHLTTTDRFYYRDRYDPSTEKTPAEREADNLHSKPTYVSTPSGPVPT